MEAMAALGLIHIAIVDVQPFEADSTCFVRSRDDFDGVVDLAVYWQARPPWRAVVVVVVVEDPLRVGPSTHYGEISV